MFLKYKTFLVLALVSLGIFSSYDTIIAILLIGFCANDDEHLIPLLVVGPIFETAFVLTPGFTFSALLGIFLILKAVIKLFANRNPGQSSVLLVIALLYLLLSFMYGAATSGGRGLMPASVPQIISAFSKILLLWAVYRITREQNFVWSRFWLQQKILGLGTLLLVYAHLMTQITAYNWYNSVERLGYQGADLNEFSISCVALVPLILGRQNVRIVSGTGLACMVLVLLLIFKTVSLSATVIFCSALFLHSFREKSLRLFLLVAAVGTALFFSDVVSTLSETSIGVRSTFLSEGGTQRDVTTGRLTLWVGAIPGIWEYLWWGVGPGATTEASFNHLYSGIELVTHNTILQFLISFGLVGALCLIFTLVLFKRLLFSFSHYALICSMVILSAGAMSLSWLWKDSIWILLGLHIGYNYAKRSANNSNFG